MTAPAAGAVGFLPPAPVVPASPAGHPAPVRRPRVSVAPARHPGPAHNRDRAPGNGTWRMYVVPARRGPPRRGSASGSSPSGINASGAAVYGRYHRYLRARNNISPSFASSTSFTSSSIPTSTDPPLLRLHQQHQQEQLQIQLRLVEQQHQKHHRDTSDRWSTDFSASGTNNNNNNSSISSSSTTGSTGSGSDSGPFPRPLTSLNAASAAGAPHFTMSSAEPWLYRPPPPYCPIPVVQPDDDLVSAVLLHGRIDYLGPVARNKVLRAVDMAKTRGMPMLAAQNISVAAIVADLQMDVDTVCAAVLRGLLHEPKDVEENVGPDVAAILKLHAEVTRVVDVTNDTVFSDGDYATLRELILVSAVDHRAISLELASAVVATRSLDSLPAHHDKLACARRAMHLYAPLANQLGIWIIQSELEELAFMHLHPKAFHAIRAELAHRMRESQRVLEERKLVLERALSVSPAVRNTVRSVQIKGRIKGTYSCYRKLVRKGKSLSDIYDLLALRIIVQARGTDDGVQAQACYAVGNVVLNCFPTVGKRAKDYVAYPKPNGYRSLHLTVAPTEDAPAPLEIQIRTEKMHYVAEFGAAAHWVYKADALGEPASQLSFFDFSNQGGAGVVRAEDSASLLPPIASAEATLQSVGSAIATTSSDAVLGSSIFDSANIASVDDSSDDDNKMDGNSGCSVARGVDDTSAVTEVDERFSAEWSALQRDLDFARSMMDRGRMGEHEFYNKRRGGYVSALVSAIIASRVIVHSCGHLYRLTVGSTLKDLACKMGMASRGVIALVNGIPVPLTHRLQMSDNVRWL